MYFTFSRLDFFQYFCNAFHKKRHKITNKNLNYKIMKKKTLFFKFKHKDVKEPCVITFWNVSDISDAITIAITFFEGFYTALNEFNVGQFLKRPTNIISIEECKLESPNQKYYFEYIEK